MVVLDDDGVAGKHHAPIDPRSSIGQRFEESVVGQAVLSVAVGVLLIIGIVWNLPASFVKDALMPTVRPVAALTGMQQAWEMYGPDPIARLENVQIPVTMSDGTERVWRWQPGDKVIGPFSWYRWQKLMEQVVRDPDSRAGLAHWAVRHVTSPGERPVHVEMVFRYQLLPAPGKDVPDDVSVTSLYSEDLNGRP